MAAFGNLGSFGDLKLVYTGSYLDRHIDQQADYSNYLRSAARRPTTPAPARAPPMRYFRSAKPTTCYAPVGNWNDNVENTHQSHESA